VHRRHSAAAADDSAPLILRQVLLGTTRIHLDDAVRAAELTADEASEIFDRLRAHLDAFVGGDATRRPRLRLVGRR